jgi:uncharacterized protein YndB with AHSA1/START domain
MPETPTEADRTVTILRKMAAPLRHVYAAHASAEHISRWFGPEDYPVTECLYDFRVGGRWRKVMIGPDGKKGPPFGGTFLEIVPERRIVYTNRFEGGDSGEMALQTGGEEMIFTTLFEADEGATIVTLTIRFATVEMREEYLGVGMREGIASSHDQWEQLARTLGD